MRIFYRYEGSRYTMDLPQGCTVSWLKQRIKALHGLVEVSTLERPVLTLQFAGAELKDPWVLDDLGICNGDTLTVGSRYIARPSLFVLQSHNGETLQIEEDDPKFLLSKVAFLRGYISQKLGIPVGVFRLLSPTGMEMYDQHTLDSYQIRHGSLLTLESWDGWNDFLNLAALGVTSHINQQFSSNESVCRYQMRVALYIASHFGHVNLASYLLKKGTRPDQAVGLHPSRQWCSGDEHVERLRAPVHEATESGKIDLLRMFFQYNVCALFTRDGRGRMPLNMALQRRQRECAQFILSKQFSRINVTSTQSITLHLFSKVLEWANRARERVYIRNGARKSTLKWKTAPMNKVLVGVNKVQVDGFGRNVRTSRSSPLHKIELEEAEAMKKEIGNSNEGKKAEEYFCNSSAHRLNKRNNTRFKRRLFPQASGVSLSKTPAEEDTLLPVLSRDDSTLRIPSERSVSELCPRLPSKADQRPPPSRQSVGSAIRTARERNQVIPLPMKSCAGAARPYYRPEQNSQGEDIVQGTISQFERYQGAVCRRSALERLSIAHSFSGKPWLEQVRIALNVSARAVRRSRSMCVPTASASSIETV